MTYRQWLTERLRACQETPDPVPNPLLTKPSRAARDGSQANRWEIQPQESYDPESANPKRPTKSIAVQCCGCDFLV